MGVHQHRKAAPKSVKLGILSVSTTRSIDTDESGLWIAKRARREGHDVRFHQMVTDDIAAIRHLVPGRHRCDRQHGGLLYARDNRPQSLESLLQ